MENLIVTDIFGRTNAVEKLADSFNLPTHIYDPYDGEKIPFNDEQAAYHTFSTQVTLDKYYAGLVDRIHQLSQPINLLGFSVGAAAIWRLSADIGHRLVKQAWCYYGGQIRHFVEIQPLFPVQLVFPCSEPHFSVAALIDKLTGLAQVEIRQLPYRHGFINPLSANYHPTAVEHEQALWQRQGL